MRAFWLLLITTFLLPACGSEGVTLSDVAVDQNLDHFRLVVPAVIESGYAKFEIRIIAENRSGEILPGYQDDWPEAYPFLIVPGWKSFVPKIEGGMKIADWQNGVAIFICHFDRGVFYEESCPVQGYWTLLLQENGPIVTDNSYTPWTIEIQGRVYW